MKQALNEHQTKVDALARYVWDSDLDADTFLNAPHSQLEGQTPLEASQTAEGAARVELLLQSLFHGLPS